MQGGDGQSVLERNGEIYCTKHRSIPLNGVYDAPIDRLGWGGRWIRHKLLAGIVAGVPAIVKFQSIRQPWLDTVMQILSFMGTEDFYTPIILLLAIVIDSRFAYLFTVLMGLGFYAATFLKNSLRLPRPPTPPVHVLEDTLDWALPSLHSLIGIALPWYLFIYISQSYSLNTFALICFFAFIFFWSVSVSVSRVYLGVHSLADIIAGVIPGLILLLTFLVVDDSLDLYLTQMPNVALLVIFIFYCMGLSIHPSSGPPTHSFGETVITTSVALGMMLGYARTLGPDRWFYTALMEQESAAELSMLSLVTIAIARILLGTPLIFATRVVVKAVVKEALFECCHLMGIPAYSFSHYKKTAVQVNKHYTDNYRIPPIQGKCKPEYVSENGKTNGASNGKPNGVINGMSNGNSNGYTIHMNGHTSIHSSSRMPFDVDIPIKCITYIIMGWLAMEWFHHLFHALGLTAHTS